MRKLSAVTKPIFFPLPLLEDVFKLVAENNASVYSTMDLSFSYHQLFLKDSSKPKTCFVTHRGSYQYTRVCFGLQGAPATFNYLLSHVLRNILFSYALTYVDDCICFSSLPEKHLEHLTEFFNRFRQANLRLNPTKSKFGMAEVIYLGHKLSRHGVSACEDKLEVIRSFPTPKNAQQLRSYLGIANYYRTFVEKFSMKTANLRSLLKRDAKFVWNCVHDREFEFLKNALCSRSILAFPNMQKPFILSTDACCTGISFILSQLDDKGHEHPICYGGRGLRKAEFIYTVPELECLAIIEGTR